MKYRALLVNGTHPHDRVLQEFGNTQEALEQWATLTLGAVDEKEFPNAKVVITKMVEQVVKEVKR